MMAKHWWLVGCVAFAFGTQAQTGPSGASARVDPERQLQLIRDALIETTMAAPVRVQSYGWIDMQGRLHESTQFTSDTRVRGVRVQSYVEDPAAAPVQRVQVDADVLPSGLGRQAEVDPQRCLASPRRWRQALHVEAVYPAAEAQLPLIQNLQQAFLDAARESRRWVAQRRPLQLATPYEQALFGRDSDRTEWLARIELAGSPSAPEARIEVAPIHQPAQARRVRVPLEYFGSVPSSAALSGAMANALAALERQSACDPLWYSVAGVGDRLHLREGVAHGLQPGDRLLLVERQHLPSRLLEPGAARALALVQVGVPAAHGTPLRWLAGPQPVQAGDWVALPL